MTVAVPPEAQSPEFGPHAPEHGIFPLHPADVVESLGNIARSSDDMLRLITSARSAGSADELYVNVVRDQHEAWHIEAGDFSAGAVHLYRAGLLYGIDLAQVVSKQQRVGTELKADNPDAYTQARDYLRETYRGLDDTETKNWRRQKLRELQYTGSDVLTMANAGLYDRIDAFLEQNDLKQTDDSALHVGLVDGAIFVNAYEHYLRGQEPKIFEEYTENVPAYNQARHRIDPENLLSAKAVLQFDGIKDLVDNIAHLREYKADEVRFSLEGARYVGRTVLVQFGPNEFTEMFEPAAVELTPHSKKLLTAIGVGSLAVEGIAHMADFPIDSKLVLSFVGICLFARVMKETREIRNFERRFAENMNLPLVSSS